MRQVKYAVANSLDNFIARADGGADWIVMDDEMMQEFPKLFASFDTMLMGRKTYDLALTQSSETGQGDSGFMGMKTYVFSRTLAEKPDADVRIVSENAGDCVRNLKNESGKDIWLMGGGDLAASLFKENLIDEISLTIHPVLLGSGVPLLPGIDRQVDLQRLDCKTYKNGLVSLTYRVKH
jgi:dihydrofolate reductase